LSIRVTLSIGVSARNFTGFSGAALHGTRAGWHVMQAFETTMLTFPHADPG
jgi:hypothetical protein